MSCLKCGNFTGGYVPICNDCYDNKKGNPMTPPEDKAPDMPSEIWIVGQRITDMGNHSHYEIINASTGQYIVREMDDGDLAEAICDVMNTRTIQSPDQGAVLINGVPAFTEGVESITFFHQALTRPPLDLAGLKRDAELMIARIGGGYDAIRGAKMALDHLQAIRPDLFGGKKI